MPTYQYECNKCGERFDVFQSFSEEPLKKHPGTCRGKVVKVLSAAGIVFSGSGFYKTDNRSGANGGAKHDGAKHDGAQKNGESKNGETKKDSGAKESTSSSSGSDSSSKPSTASTAASSGS